MSEVTNRGLWHARRGLALASASVETGSPATSEQFERAVEFTAEVAIQFNTWARMLYGLVEERRVDGAAGEEQVTACFSAFRHHLREAAVQACEASAALKELAAATAEVRSPGR